MLLERWLYVRNMSMLQISTGEHVRVLKSYIYRSRRIHQCYRSRCRYSNPRRLWYLLSSSWCDPCLSCMYRVYQTMTRISGMNKWLFESPLSSTKSQSSSTKSQSSSKKWQSSSTESQSSSMKSQSSSTIPQSSSTKSQSSY